MNSPVYFFDTYAFFEVIRGNPNYKKYLDVHLITTILNLAELNYNLKKHEGKKTADYYTDKYKPFIVTIDVDDIKKAMDLKIERKDLSIPDAVGYIIAGKHGAIFLTGDEDFRNMSHVEFVK